MIGKPNRAVSEVIPYLASLPGVISYNPETLAITFRRQPGFLTVYPEQVFITQVQDVNEALQLLEALQIAINTVWSERDQLTPVTSRRRAARPLDVWALLPRTNCQECGEATCISFAVLLIQGNRRLTECPTVTNDPTFANQRETLQALV